MQSKMKLYGTVMSPYVRKTRIAALELESPVDFIAIDLAEWGSFGSINPIHRVPVLELYDGTRVFDSQVICEYLDSVALGKDPLFPPAPERWRALRVAMLGNGILDAAVPRRHEDLRPVEQRSERRMMEYERSIRQILDDLEREPPAGEPIDIGGICVAAGLGYLDFRFSRLDWRNGRPALTTWFEPFSKRKSMVTTPHS